MKFQNLFKNILFILFLFLLSCQPEKTDVNKLFANRNNIGIHFENTLTYTEDFNPYLYRNFYNGGGVSCGDINNDGLIDIFFTGNQVENKLYLNLGNWKFEDITEKAGVACPDVWCTGANMVDVNADGLLDLYVCKGGDPKGPRRHNELFINNGDLTFTDQAKKYGLDIKGLSIQSAFLDFDKDGDLDCYILNNSTKPIGGGLDLKSTSRDQSSPEGNKFMINENGKFKDAARHVGIYNSDIGFGLGITISDFNLDDWPDIYISNDFFEKDYLYLNQQNGTFEESGTHYFNSFSMGAMGADAGDLDNDLCPDLMVTEMFPGTLERQKTKAVYESWKKYQLAIKQGYDHQFPRNTLQRNLAGQSFSEIGRMAGVHATDWSWSCLIQDFNNDTNKEIFITNGIYKDLLDRDYLGFIADKERVGSMIKQGERVITRLIDSMPSTPISNHIFANTGNLFFEDKATEWGLGKPGFSNGCAYADLDNDGDQDLIINNVNAPSTVFENTSRHFEDHHYIDLQLSMDGKNPFAIGSKVYLYHVENKFVQELFPSRGFQSSVPYRLHTGLGKLNTPVDSIIVVWPNGKYERFENLPTDSLYVIEKGSGVAISNKPNTSQQKFRLDTLHTIAGKNSFDQFDRDKLIHRMNPKKSPVITKIKGTKNHYFIGAPKNQKSSIVKITDKEMSILQSFDATNASEVNDVVFLDMDKDGDEDIFLACGGSAFIKNDPGLKDIILENKGTRYEVKNNFVDCPSFAASAALAYDWNEDGYEDLLVADRKSNQPYGEKGSIHLLINQEGNGFKSEVIPAFENLGMISDMSLMDADEDGIMELIVVGEWMEVSIFALTGNNPIKSSIDFGLENSRGLWNHVNVQDFNNDGKDDLFIGNCGHNTGINTTHVLVVADFDKNGKKDPILCLKEGSKYFPVLDKDELTSVFPQLNKRFLKYHKYAKASLSELLGSKQVANAEKLPLQMTASKLYLNDNGQLKEVDLPKEVQYSSVHCTILSEIFGEQQILIGGNHYQVKPQYGREDGSEMWRVSIPDGQQKVNAESLQINGEIRSLVELEEGFIFTNTNGDIIRCSEL